MLVITRKVGETVVLDLNGRRCEIKVVSNKGNQVRLGFEAEREIHIVRKELEEKDGNFRTD